MRPRDTGRVSWRRRAHLQERTERRSRPIRMTSIPGKILGAVLKDTVHNRLPDGHMPRGSQHGFVARRSYLTLLLAFYDRVTRHLHKGEEVDSIHLAVKKSLCLPVPQGPHGQSGGPWPQQPYGPTAGEPAPWLGPERDRCRSNMAQGDQWHPLGLRTRTATLEHLYKPSAFWYWKQTG